MNLAPETASRFKKELVLFLGVLLFRMGEKLGPLFHKRIAFCPAGFDEKSVTQISKLQSGAKLQEGATLSGVTEAIRKWCVAIKPDQHGVHALRQIMGVLVFLRENDIHVQDCRDIA